MHVHNVADELAEMLASLGVKQAYGITGGAITTFFDALNHSTLQVIHCRHESGAAFAACEASFAGGFPVAVFATTGPGITNALTGLYAARWEGARILFISPATPDSMVGRLAIQETSRTAMAYEELIHAGPLFHFAVRMESASQIPDIA